MNLRFQFDSEKATEVITYLASNAPIPDIYHVCKLLYFADRLHLERFGRSICGDTYYALKDGPVPSGTYDLIKDVRDTRKSMNYAHASASFVVDEGGKVIAIRQPDLDVFSNSDIQCLDEAIAAHGKQSFKTIRDITHDKVWNSADKNGEIAIQNLVLSLKNGEEILDYLQRRLTGS